MLVIYFIEKEREKREEREYIFEIEMVSTVERQKVLNRKLQVLKTITNSKAEKKDGILMDALTYINQLKQKVDDMTKEYGDLIKQVHVPTMDVEVEKLEDNCFAVTVTCEKAQNLFVLLLEAFDEAGLDVLHADINCSQFFHLEAIVEAEDGTFDVEKVTETIHKVLENKGVKKNPGV